MRAMMPWIKQNIRPLVAALILLTGLILALQIRKPRVTLEEVSVSHHEKATIKLTVDAQIRPLNEAYLVLRKGGSLDEIRVQEGSTVAKGDIIAIVNANRNEARLRRALSQYRLSSSDYARTQNLFSSATETRQSLDMAQNALNVARSDVEEAKKDLEDSLIRAPFPGIVSFIAFKVGDFIPDGGRVAVVEDRASVLLTARITRQYRSYFPYRGAVSLTDATAQTYDLDDVTMKLAGEEKFFEDDFDVEARLENIPSGIKLGQKLKINLPIVTLENVLSLPLTALNRSEKGDRLLVLKDGKYLAWETVDLKATEGSVAYIAHRSDKNRAVQPLNVKNIDEVIGTAIRPIIKRGEVAAKD